MTSNEIIARARETIEVEIAALNKTSEVVGEDFVTAVGLILKALDSGAKIVVTGVGKNLPIAEKMAATLASTGSTAIVLNPVQAMHGDLGMLQANDVVLALSFSGESDEILHVLPAIRNLGAPVIGMAGRADCSMAKYCEVMLIAPCEKEACPFGMAPTASTTATLALGDALAMVLIDARGFKKEDYARFHPAGAIGRALLLKVGDIMRKGERVARLLPSATIIDAINAMTHAQSGAACIADSEENFLGIFTDGDLRRALLHGMSLDTPLEEIYTRTNKFVRDSQHASDLLAIFEKFNIDDVPVLDDAGRLVGCIDITDLPKMKML